MALNHANSTEPTVRVQAAGRADRTSTTKLRRLPRAPMTSSAAQCRALGLRVGDVIVGREVHRDGAWCDARLELAWLGEEAALFRETSRSSVDPVWRAQGESANWTLCVRDWCVVPRSCAELGGPAVDDPLLMSDGHAADAAVPGTPATPVQEVPQDAGCHSDAAAQQMAGELAALRQCLQQIAAVPPVGDADAYLDGKRAQVCQEMARRTLVESGQRLSAHLKWRLDPHPGSGVFWTDVVKDGGTWTHTLRTKGDWPGSTGIEVARLNPLVMARYPGLGEKIARACTNHDAVIEALQVVHEHCAQFSEMPVDSAWLAQTAADALDAAGVRPRAPNEPVPARLAHLRQRP